MGCTYSIDVVEIPDEAKDKVEALFKELDIEGVFAIDIAGGNYFIGQEEYAMAYSTANVITEQFLPKIAELIKGTDLDGQVLNSYLDDEPATIVLINGEAKGYDGQLTIISAENVNWPGTVAPGEEAEVELKAKVLALPEGKALILKR